MAPHFPFVFGEKGQPFRPSRRSKFGMWERMDDKLRQEYVQNYRDQLAFITKKTMETIENILSSSTEPPIIILQSDHGPKSMIDEKTFEENTNSSLTERMSILNAIYLPRVAREEIYDSITPVNTFRLVFNSVFGTSYELMQDKNYYSTWVHPYKFINVTDKINTFVNDLPPDTF